MGGDGGGEGGVGVLVEGGVFGGAAAEPGTEGSGFLGGDFLGEQGAEHATEDIAHAAGGHAGVAGAVVAGGVSVVGDEGAGAFEEEGQLGVLGGEGFDLLAAIEGRGGEVGGEALPFAGMRGEEARAGLGEGGEDGGEGVEGVGVDDGGGGVFGKEIEDFGVVSAAEAGADDESVVGKIEGSGVGGHGFDHDFGRKAGGEELVEIGFDQEGDHAGAAVEGTEAGEFGGPEEAWGASDDEEASGLGFVGVEGAAGEEGAKESGGNEFGGIAGGGDEVGEGDEGEATDVMGGGVGDEAGFDLGDGEGEIGLEGAGMGDAGVGIEATGEVHGDGLSVGGGAEGVHLSGEGRE